MADIEIMRKRFMTEPLIDTQLPIVFSNGGEFSELTGECDRCKAEITGTYLRGLVRTPIKDVVTFDAHCLCEACMTLFPVHGRIKAIGKSMRMEWINKEGRWVSGMLESTNPIKRYFRQCLRKIFT